MTHAHYDYIIAGGGAAGLSLIYHLLQTRLGQKNILIIDRDEKQANDRTWCFWEAGPGPFEAVVHHRWQHTYFHGENYSDLLELHPYQYKMIRSSDYYQHIKQAIAVYPNVEWLSAEVQGMHEAGLKAQVVTSAGTFTADWVFSSLRDPRERAHLNGYTYLLQHFKGWVIQTPQDFFNPRHATLMDFRIAQHGECRFFYVLPTDARTALVEFTLFSPKLLPEPEYEAALQDYLRRFLSLDDYTIAHEEFGVIPMTNKPYPERQSEHVINIGTAGGRTKPSTGYTFRRIHQDSEQLVGSLLRTGRPLRVSTSWDQRFRLYDSTLFQVMERPGYPVKKIFTDLFRQNPADRVLRFLDERSSFTEELQIANSVNRGAFARGMWRAISS
jgi:lycopene beta-cyclase